MIGNYGTNDADAESRSPHVRGFVIEELSEVASNWRSEVSLEEYLRRWKIPGAQGIDTRALTRHLRTLGAMKACLTTEEISAAEAVRRAVEGAGVIGMDYVREVTAPSAYQWDPDDRNERRLGDGKQQENQPAADPASHRGLRLRDQGKHSAPAAPERFRRDRRARHNDRGGSPAVETGRRLSFQRPGRSLGP